MADDISVRFGGDMSGLNDSIAKATSSITNFGTSIKSAFSGFDTSGATSAFKATGDSAEDAGDRSSGPLGKIAEYAKRAVLYLFQVGEQAALMGDKIRTAAGAFDQTGATMTQIGAIADRSGLSMEDIGKSFAKLQKDASGGDKDMIAALGAIGLKAKDVADLTQTELAVKMADAFSSSAASANKTATAVALFGDGVAGKLVPQLDQGAAHILDLVGAADRAGTVIGPELQGKLDGTSSMMQKMKDAFAELALTVEGRFLQTFVALKPAIDAIIQVATDLIKNVSSLIEWLYDLNGAGQKNIESTGLQAAAFKVFVQAIIDAVASIEEFAVRSGQRLAEVGASLDGLSKVAKAFGQDISSMATISAEALYAAFHEAINGVIVLFGDLAQAAKSALTFDTSGISTAFAKMGSDAEATGKKMSAALGPDAFRNTTAAIVDMQAHAAEAAKSLDAALDKIASQRKKASDILNGAGATAPAAGTEDVGDPSAPDKVKRNSDKIEAAMKEIEGEIKLLQDGLKQKTTIYDAEVAHRKMTEDAKFAALESETEKEYQAQLALLQKELAIDGLSLVQKQEVNNKIKALQSKHGEDMLKLDEESIAASQKAWQGYFNTFQSEFNGQLKGLLSGTTSFASAMKTIIGDLIIKLIEGIESYAFEWAAAELGMTTATQTGAAARAATQVTATAASSATMVEGVLKNIGASAAEAFAGVVGFLSPIMGPAAVGPAAGVEATVIAAGAGIGGSFAQGSWSLPSDMVAQVHAGEMIVPAAQTPWAQALMSNAAGAGQGGGSPMTANISINHTSYGSRSTAAIKAESGVIIDAIHANMRSYPMKWKESFGKHGL